MKTLKAKCLISISRPSFGDHRKAIQITLTDVASGVGFFKGEMPLDQFSETITGLYGNIVDAEMQGLEHIGKMRVTERREIICPIKTYDHKILKPWLEENGQEEGWIISGNLSSQNSVEQVEDGTLLRYFATKFVEPTEE